MGEEGETTLAPPSPGPKLSRLCMAWTSRPTPAHALPAPLRFLESPTCPRCDAKIHDNEGSLSNRTQAQHFLSPAQGNLPSNPVKGKPSILLLRTESTPRTAVTCLRSDTRQGAA